MKIIICYDDDYYLIQGGYGNPSLEGYYAKLTGAFKKFISGLDGKLGNYTPKLEFDGANGVGAPAMKEFAKHLEGVLEVNMHNTGMFLCFSYHKTNNKQTKFLFFETKGKLEVSFEFIIYYFSFIECLKNLSYFRI